MEGLEGVKKLWDYFDLHGFRPSFFFQAESSEPFTVAKAERMVRELKLLSENQVQWLIGQLFRDPSKLLSGKTLEEVLGKLKPIATRSHESQRALLRLRKYLQEKERCSLAQAFSQMTNSGRTLHEWLVQLPCQLPETDVIRIEEALKAEGALNIDTWLRVLCAAMTAPEVYRPLSGGSRPASILLAAESSDPKYAPLSATSRRPLTAPSLKSSRSVLKQAWHDTSACVSSTHWSESSSVQPVQDPSSVLIAQPGEKLVASGRLLTNAPDLGEVRPVHKTMRALRTFAYAGPGRHHEVLGEVEEGGVVVVKERNGVWAKVICGEYEGWVPLCKLDEETGRRLYSAHDARPHPEPTKRTGALSKVYVRKEPHWGSQALEKLKATEQTQVQGATDSWVKVATSTGMRGWVPRSHTSLSAITTPRLQELLIPPPVPVVHEDLNTHRAFFTSSVLSTERVEELRGTIESKMKNLQTQYQEKLRGQVDRMELKRHFVRNWLKMELSRALRKWRFKAFARSKYDRFTEEMTQALRLTRQASAQAIIAKKAARLRSVRSARNLSLK